MKGFYYVISKPRKNREGMWLKINRFKGEVKVSLRRYDLDEFGAKIVSKYNGVELTI